MPKKTLTFTYTALLIIILITGLFPMRVKASLDSEPKTVRVGYYQNEAFEAGAGDGAVKTGYAYEYYRKISEYTGWKYEYVYGDFVTIYKKLLEGEVDLVAGLAYTEGREGKILYPDRPMGSERYGIVKHENDISVTADVNTLVGKTIGVLDSAIVDKLNEFLDEREVAARIVTFNDYETLLSSFDQKRVDVIAAEIDGIYDRNHAQVLYSFGGSDYYLCVNKDRPDILEDLNNGQTQLFSDDPDYLSALRRKYYSTALSSRALTSSEYEWITFNGQISIGYLNNFLPYSDTDKDGHATGMVSEVFEKMFKDLGVNAIAFNYKGYDNYDDMMEAVRNGAVDVAFPVGGGLFYSEEDGLLMSDPVSSTLTDLVYNEKHMKGRAADFAVNENIKLQYYYIKTNYPDSTMKSYDSLDDCLTAVQNGEVSYTTLNGLMTNSIFKKGTYDDLSFIQLPYRTDVSFGVKIGNNGLLKLLNRGISIMGSDYTQNMAFRYSEKMNTFTLKDFYYQYSWLFFLIALGIATFIVVMLSKDAARNKKRLQEKEAAQMEIEKANHEKFVFVNKMANYMREPTRKLGSLIDLAGDSRDSSSIDEYLKEMKSYNRELSSIINNILNMSRFESGQMTIEDKNISRHLQGKRVLISEDTMQSSMITGRILKRFGFEIQVATGGKEVYDKLNAAPEGYFDAVVMDIDINEEEQLKDAAAIRTLSNDGKAAIPIIAIASGDFEKIQDYINDGTFSALIKKPYDTDSMTDIFAGIFNRQEV